MEKSKDDVFSIGYDFGYKLALIIEDEQDKDEQDKDEWLNGMFEGYIAGKTIVEKNAGHNMGHEKLEPKQNGTYSDWFLKSYEAVITDVWQNKGEEIKLKTMLKSKNITILDNDDFEIECKLELLKLIDFYSAKYFRNQK